MCLTQISAGILGMAIPVYPSDVNDAEWALLAPLIPTSKPRKVQTSETLIEVAMIRLLIVRLGQRI